jgi:hypothetical protein
MLVAECGLHQVERCTVFAFLQPKRLGNRGNNQGGIVKGGQGDETDPISKVTAQLAGDTQRQPGLADATRAGERQQAHFWPSQERADRGHFLFAPNEWGEWQRQGVVAKGQEIGPVYALGRVF